MLYIRFISTHSENVRGGREEGLEGFKNSVLQVIKSKKHNSTCEIWLYLHKKLVHEGKSWR